MIKNIFITILLSITLISNSYSAGSSSGGEGDGPKTKSNYEKAVKFINFAKKHEEKGKKDKAQSNYEKALKCNTESTKIAKEYNNKKLLANNYYHLSMLMIDKGNFIKSKKNINKAIKIAKKEQYMRNAAKYLDCLGIILRQERKFTDSIKVNYHAAESSSAFDEVKSGGCLGHCDKFPAIKCSSRSDIWGSGSKLYS